MGTNESASITLWREAFAASGIDPDEFPSSIEALIHAAVQGTGPNPINPAVDLANAVSLRYQLPIGAHDMDKLRGDFEVRGGRAGDRFTPLGKLELEDVPAGEPVYADENEVRTRRWVWRLGERGKVTKASTNVFFPIDGFTGQERRASQASGPRPCPSCWKVSWALGRARSLSIERNQSVWCRCLHATALTMSITS